MLRLRRVCVLGPDQWAATLVSAIRQFCPHAEVVCVAAPEVGQEWVNCGKASRWTESFLDGLHDADILVLGLCETGPVWNLREAVISCEPNAILCGHGRTMTEVSRIVRELDRKDFHYLNVIFGGSLDWSNHVAGASVEQLNGQRVAVTPLSIEDLNAFSSFSELLRNCGCTVTAVSPLNCDRQLAEYVQVPQLLRVPFLHYLADSQTGSGEETVVESYRLFGDFAGMGRSTSELWSTNLFHNKAHVVSALEGCQEFLTQLITDLRNDKMQELASSVQRQAGELQSLTDTTAARLDTLPTPAAEATPEALVGMLDVAIRMAKRLSVRDGVSLQAVHELIARTRATVEDVLRAQTVRPDPLFAPTASQEAATSDAALRDDDLGSAPGPTESWAPPTADTWEQPMSATDLESSVDSQPLERDYAPEVQTMEPSAEAVPCATSPVLSISCGHDLHTLQTAAQLLTQNRIEIDQIDRDETPSGLTLRVTLARPEQAGHARELLQAANVPVS